MLAGRIFKAFSRLGIDRRSIYPVLSGYRLNLTPSYYLADCESLFLDKCRPIITHSFFAQCTIIAHKKEFARKKCKVIMERGPETLR